MAAGAPKGARGWSAVVTAVGSGPSETPLQAPRSHACVCVSASLPPPRASPRVTRWGVVWRLSNLGDPGPPRSAACLLPVLCASPHPAHQDSGAAVAGSSWGRRLMELSGAPCLAGILCPSCGWAWSCRSCLFSLCRRGSSSGPATELVSEARRERGRPVRVWVCNKSVFKRFCVVTFAVEPVLCGCPPNPRHPPSMWPTPSPWLPLAPHGSSWLRTAGRGCRVHPPPRGLESADHRTQHTAPQDPVATCQWKDRKGGVRAEGRDGCPCRPLSSSRTGQGRNP